MGTPVLLVHDDLLAIDSVKQLLVREGCEVAVATSAADAVLAFGQRRPALVLLWPGVEGGRGRVALQGLEQHPDWSGCPLLFLGEAVPGFDGAVVPLPLDAAGLAKVVRGVLRSAAAEAKIGRAASYVEGETVFAPSSEVPEQLTPILARLCEEGPACLELVSSDGKRILWLDGARLVGAISFVEGESVLDRALAAGLIPGQVTSRFQHLQSAPAEELVQSLRSEGYLRDAEVIPLLQKHAEEIALAAFSAPDSSCRLRRGEEPPELTGTATTKSSLELMSEAMRTRFPPELMLERIGGLGAIPVCLEQQIPESLLGLSEGDRQLFARVDGKVSVQTLLQAAGVDQSRALSLLFMLKSLKLLDFMVTEAPPQSPSSRPDIEVERLNSKLEQAQEADYFSILGVSRSAGAEEVRRTFEQLSAQFDPLRFAGHPDPAVVDKATELQGLLREAFQALRDDSLRESYARNLRD